MKVQKTKETEKTYHEIMDSKVARVIEEKNFGCWNYKSSNCVNICYGSQSAPAGAWIYWLCLRNTHYSLLSCLKSLDASIFEHWIRHQWHLDCSGGHWWSTCAADLMRMTTTSDRSSFALNYFRATFEAARMWQKGQIRSYPLISWIFSQQSWTSSIYPAFTDDEHFNRDLQNPWMWRTLVVFFVRQHAAAIPLSLHGLELNNRVLCDFDNRLLVALGHDMLVVRRQLLAIIGRSGGDDRLRFATLYGRMNHSRCSSGPWVGRISRGHNSILDWTFDDAVPMEEHIYLRHYKHFVTISIVFVSCRMQGTNSTWISELGTHQIWSTWIGSIISLLEVPVCHDVVHCHWIDVGFMDMLAEIASRKSFFPIP